METAWFQKISGQEAEKIMGRKLDKRKTYYKKTDEGIATDNSFAYPGNNSVFVYDTWVDLCSGCTDYGDYGTQYGPFGCQECGYTGKRRNGMHTPLNLEEWVKQDERKPPR